MTDTPDPTNRFHGTGDDFEPPAEASDDTAGWPPIGEAVARFRELSDTAGNPGAPPCPTCSGRGQVSYSGRGEDGPDPCPTCGPGTLADVLTRARQWLAQPDPLPDLAGVRLMAELVRVAGHAGAPVLGRGDEHEQVLFHLGRIEGTLDRVAARLGETDRDVPHPCDPEPITRSDAESRIHHVLIDYQHVRPIAVDLAAAIAEALYGPATEMAAVPPPVHQAYQVALLNALTDTEPCQFDHHGTCQAHLTGEVNGECANAVARSLIDTEGTPTPDPTPEETHP